MSEEEKQIQESLANLKDQQIVDRVTNRYHGSKDATQVMRQTLWDRWFNVFRQKHDSSSAYPYRSRIYVPVAFAQIRTILNFIMRTIFNGDAPFKLIDSTNLQILQKEGLERYINLQLENMGIYGRMQTFILNMCIYGTGVAKVYWENDVEVKKSMRKVMKPKFKEFFGQNIPIGFETVEEEFDDENVKFRGPVFTNIDLQDFYIDPKATQLKGFWKGHIIEKTLEQLKAGNKKADGKLYKNLRQLEMSIHAKSQGESEEEREKIDKKREGGVNVDANMANDNGKIKLFEYWTPDSTEFYLVALDYGVLLRKSENVFDHKEDPFVFARFQEVPGEFWGIGIPEITYGLQLNINTITNQRNDNINLVLNRMWKVKKDAGINFDTVKSAPGKRILVEEMDDLEQLETKDVTNSAYTEVQSNKNEMQEAIGTKYISGANPTGSNRTATGVQLNQNAESTTTMGIFHALEDTCLKPMIKKMYLLNRQFNTTDQVVKVLGPRGKAVNFSVKPELFTDDRTFYAAGIRNALERNTQVHQMTNFMAIIGREDPQMLAASGFNKMNLYKRIWETMGLDRWDELAGNQELNREMQEQQMADQAQQQASSDISSALGKAITDASKPSNSEGSGNQAGGQQGTRIQ